MRWRPLSRILHPLGQLFPRAIEGYSIAAPKQLAAVQKRLLEHTLRDFRRAGMSLPADQRAQLTGIERELNRLSIEFENNESTLS